LICHGRRVFDYAKDLLTQAENPCLATLMIN
jgi:hypothetical protein